MLQGEDGSFEDLVSELHAVRGLEWLYSGVAWSERYLMELMCLFLLTAERRWAGHNPVPPGNCSCDYCANVVEAGKHLVARCDLSGDYADVTVHRLIGYMWNLAGAANAGVVKPVDPDDPSFWSRDRLVSELLKLRTKSDQ